MSYDLEIGVKIENYDKILPIAYPEYENPTYNLGPMFRACMEWDYKQGEWYKCSEVIEKIDHGIRELTLHEDEYIQYNADNGWGTTETALRDLKSLRDCIYETAELVPIEHLYMRW